MRIITFRFDDGLWHGTQKAIRILGEFHASFFIVKNWLSEYNFPIQDEFNKGRYHGSIDEWKEVSAMGHDVQSHSCSHRTFSNLTIEERTIELKESLELLTEIHEPPYSMCYPYNDMTPDNLVDLGYEASGFYTRPSDQNILYNHINQLEIFNLKSWAIREHHLENIKVQLQNVPDDTWIILAMHSLDNEGWEPWSQASFSELVNFIAAHDFEILSLSETLAKL